MRFRRDIVQPHHRIFPRLVVAVRRWNVRTDRALAAGPAEVVANLMAEDAHEPGAVGGLPGETVAGLERGEEGKARYRIVLANDI